LKNSIDDVLRYTLGESGSQALKFHLNTKKYWKDPKRFHAHLQSVLREGSLVLEVLILKDLFKHLGMLYEESTDVHFVEQIDAAKRISKARRRGAAAR